uniref:Uncharacterized protein n=1 Tax=Oryza meridionalis TaxID=40149 RepID=A0A0E0F008_9ORYZ
MSWNRSIDQCMGAVVPVLFEHSLRRAQDDAVVTVGQVLGISPAVKLSNPATDSEVALALRVLEGCCLLCRNCAAAAHRYDAVKLRKIVLAVIISYSSNNFLRISKNMKD